MTYDEKLDEILSRLGKIEEVLLISKPEPARPTGGLYDFVRPDPTEPLHGMGVRMTAPDGDELVQRALYGVRWNGEVVAPVTYEEAWAEIEALQKDDPRLVTVYAEAGCDPVLAGVLLLTGYLPTVGQGMYGFNIAYDQRRDIAQKHASPQAWIDEQFAIMRGRPVVSGGDAPE